MELRDALLLIGVIIVSGVALGAYDRARVGRHFRRRPAAPPPRTQADAPSAPSSRLDINPVPPEQDKARFLTAGAGPPASRPRAADLEFYDELESLEQVAAMPLNPAAEPAPAAGPGAGRRSAMPDERIDFVVNLPGPGPVPRDKPLGIYKQNEYVLEKPHRLYGLRHIAGFWSELDQDPANADYSDLSLAIQMVDRNGAVTESELNGFVQLALKLADALRRPTRFSMTVEQALERARALDALCQQFDVLASINIAAPDGKVFRGPAIDKAATRLGMSFGPMSVYHKKNDEAKGCRHLYSLASLYKPGHFDREHMEAFQTRGLTLFMSLPCAHHPVRVFDGMVQAAKQLAQMLGGTLLDHDRRPLTDPGLAAIRDQVERLAAQMYEHHIIPGSETALRLFE